VLGCVDAALIAAPTPLHYPIGMEFPEERAARRADLVRAVERGPHGLEPLAGAAILPHGIFEIPGFIVAGALGILLAQSLVNEYYGHGDAAVEVKKLSGTFVSLVLPLIMTAAVVEAFITPQIIQLVV
jgi:hypothetical protein